MSLYKNSDPIPLNPPPRRNKLDLKYNFKSTNAALRRELNCKCKMPGCKKYFKASLWKTGIDVDFCSKHREEIREQEANQFVEKIERQERQETLNLLNEIKQDEISSELY